MSSSTGTNVLYTTDADFDQGILVNVNHDAPNNNQLQLNTTTSAFPFIWVALSQRCTIAKINTLTGTILGEYRTIADGVSCNQSSRTTVALDGSVWMGHRGPGGVTHVGLVELNQCVDRNGNGTIETSSAYGDVKLWPGSSSVVANAQDECILHHVDTDSPPLSFSDTRHMSIDKNNKLWVGDFAGGHRFIRVNGDTGAVETAVRSFGCGAYGGLIDANGVIWSANGGANGLLRWNPDAPDSATNPRCINIPVYGLAIDPGGFVWVGQLSGNAVRKVSPDGNTILGPFGHGSENAQGLAADSNGDIWVSSSLFCGGGCTIGHLKNDGTFVGNVPNPTGAGSTGVSIDAAGKPWSANLNANTATRIDPSLGPIGGDGVTPIGAVDLTVGFPASPCPSPPAMVQNCTPFPYNYSDMTGAQLLGTVPQGSWTITQDSGAAGTAWGTITWNTEPQGSVPPGASIKVEARAAETEAGLGGQTFMEVTSGTPFSLTGRFIQVRATLIRGTADASPVLSDIRISISTTGADLTALSPAKVYVGLTNSDDVGLYFDLLAEVLVNGNVAGSGQVNKVWGGSSGFNNAVKSIIPLVLPGPVAFPPGSQLSIRVSVRQACAAPRERYCVHVNECKARLWYNDSQADSSFDATIDGVNGGNSADYFLLNNFLLGTAPGPGPKKTSDVGVGKRCSPFKSFGTWNITLP